MHHVYLQTATCKCSVGSRDYVKERMCTHIRTHIFATKKASAAEKEKKTTKKGPEDGGIFWLGADSHARRKKTRLRGEEMGYVVSDRRLPYRT